MMKRFLEQIARRYYAEAGDAIGEYCFVFPNRRSSLFFNKYLGQAAGKPVFSPRLMTINDLMADLSGLRPVDKIGALHTLYTRYAELMWPGKPAEESFDRFVFWGDILLGDFDDVDKYRVDAKALFANVRDLQELNTDYDFLTPEQKAAIRTFWGNFLTSSGERPKDCPDKKEPFRTTWSILYDLYLRFREALSADGLGYEGMIYRQVAETLSVPSPERDALLTRLGRWKRIVFVGLNALNACEKKLLSTARDELGGDFYWDFEDPRTCDPDNKASLFLAANVRDYPSRYPLEPSLPEAQHFRTLSVSSATAQTRVAGDLLQEFCAQPGFDPIETAVVLPDEQLLLPMLGAVPEAIREINVTMGFPLSQSNAATFISFLERLRRNKRVSASGCSFYHKDVENLVNHPFLAAESAAQSLLSEILKQNLIYVEQRTIAAFGSELYNQVFRDVSDALALPTYQLAILDAVPEGLSAVDREFVYHLRAAVQRMQSLSLQMEEKTYYALLGQLISVISIPFRGEPLSGLQVMGPLETRALDFKNIIILSVNEGVFPKRSVSGSFIPYHLRFGYGLPNYEYQDALSSYYFYRSIARAENVIFVYDSRTEGLQSGEPSRFIKQLKYHFGVPLNEQAVSMTLQTSKADDEQLTVPKTPEVLAALRRRFIERDPQTGSRKAFSATALNTYLDCGIRFYYNYVKGIKEPDEVQEDLDAGLFGSIFHKVLEDLYRPRLGRALSREEIEAIAGDTATIDRLVVEAFASEGKIRNLTGRNLILRELLRSFVVETLRCDAQVAPLTVTGVEERRYATLELPGGETVDLKGALDRIDLRGGRRHVVDYKTGSIRDKIQFKSLDALFDPLSDKRPSIAFQLLFYALLLAENEPGLAVESLSLDVYAMQQIFAGAASEQCYDAATLTGFRTALRALIAEIFDPDIPLRAVNPKCDYCSYKLLCGK